MIPSSFFTHVHTPVGRLQLHGLRWHGAADATPLMAMHSLTRSAWDFAVLAEALAPARPILALDMPGRGLSGKLENPHHYGYPVYVAACISFLETLGRPVDWLGTSMGGLIGMIVAAQRPELIRRLILNDVGPTLQLPALRRIADYVAVPQHFATLDEAERYCRRIYAPFGITEEEHWRRFTLASVRADPKGGFALHYDFRIAAPIGALKTGVDLWPVYDGLLCPTLLLRGAESDVLSAANAEEMTLRGPQARLVVFEGCGHAPALTSPGQIAVVNRFLEHAA